MNEQSLNNVHQQQSDHDAVAAATAAAVVELGISMDNGLSQSNRHPHHFQLQQPDFSQNLKDDGSQVDVDVHGLDLPTVGDGQDIRDSGIELDDHNVDDLDLDGLGGMGTPDMDSVDPSQRGGSYGRPPSIRKACDLCHAAKQKCSGDRPTCTRCAAGGWQCIYAPRQRRRTVPKHDKHDKYSNLDVQRAQALSSLSASQSQAIKKRKLGQRESMGGLQADAMDMRMAMGMAMDMGLAGEEEGEDMLTMTDDQMLESIAIDGYLADLPLATFVHNLPYTASQNTQDNTVNYHTDDFPSSGDNTFPSTDMDQHTTSALRDAIFSLNESGAAGSQHGDATGLNGGDDQQGGQVEGLDNVDQQGLDPHLALLDLSHAMPNDDNSNNQHDGQDSGLTLPNLSSNYGGCPHTPLVPHILALLTHNGLEPKPGSNTPLTLSVLAPLARSLRLFLTLSACPTCSTSPQQTLPQLALLSRTTTILTFPFPPVNSSSVGSSAQITIHGARLSGTGVSEAIEQHIVGVIWDSWRAAIREVFAVIERKAQEIITQAHLNSTDGQLHTGTAETQRAGLMFQAMSRLVTAMDEVEGN